MSPAEATASLLLSENVPHMKTAIPATWKEVLYTYKPSVQHVVTRILDSLFDSDSFLCGRPYSMTSVDSYSMSMHQC